jgi:hypothetical protein
MSFYFKRNYEIYISTETESNANAANTISLNVKDFSFNQSSNIERVGRETLDPNQERTVDPYLSTVAPVQFSFTSYMLPMKDGGNNVNSPEEYLWVSLLGATAGFSPGATSSTFDFSEGNVATLQELTIWFSDPDKTEGNFRLERAIIDSAKIEFDINGIAEIEWSGRALIITDNNNHPTPNANNTRTNQTGYLKNKLSTLSVSRSTAFTVALTGGSIEINNNNTFYSRTQLGQTTTPVGHYTGNREITGELNVYLKSGASTSVDLFNEILTNASSNTYEGTLADITINIGGESPSPNVQINIPQALFDIPQQNFEEVITLSLPFIAKEDSGNYCQITYNIP